MHWAIGRFAVEKKKTSECYTKNPSPSIKILQMKPMHAARPRKAGCSLVFVCTPLTNQKPAFSQPVANSNYCHYCNHQAINGGGTFRSCLYSGYVRSISEEHTLTGWPWGQRGASVTRETTLLWQSVCTPWACGWACRRLMVPFNGSVDESVVTCFLFNCCHLLAETKCRKQLRAVLSSLVSSCLAVESVPAQVFTPYMAQIWHFRVSVNGERLHKVAFSFPIFIVSEWIYLPKIRLTSIQTSYILVII